MSARVTTSPGEAVKLNAPVARVAVTSLDPKRTDEGDLGGLDEGVCSAELGSLARLRVPFSVLGCEAIFVGWVVAVVASGNVFSELLASSDVAVETKAEPFTGLMVALSRGVFRPDVLMAGLELSCDSPVDNATMLPKPFKPLALALLLHISLCISNQ